LKVTTAEVTLNLSALNTPEEMFAAAIVCVLLSMLIKLIVPEDLRSVQPDALPAPLTWTWTSL
jgi:hypothetical protein